MSFHYFETAAHANVYNKFRPSPPEELVKRIVEYVIEKIPEPFQEALDIGCGSGQSTEVLAPYFQKVTGFDPSDKQIIEAQKKKNKLPNVYYRTGSAEKIDFPDGSVQLITASQSCHWFDLPKFYAEVERILTPGGVLAMYGYLLPRPRYKNIDHELCNIVDKYYTIILGRYVLPESKKVYLETYKGDDFNKVPFSIDPVFRDESTSTEQIATVSDLVGYVNSWSAFQNYQRQEGETKASEILQQFQKEAYEEKLEIKRLGPNKPDIQITPSVRKSLGIHLESRRHEYTSISSSILELFSIIDKNFDFIRVMDTIGVSGSPDDTHITIQYKYFLLMARKPL